MYHLDYDHHPLGNFVESSNKLNDQSCLLDAVSNVLKMMLL